MNVLDLFSGIGGFSLGLERAGMRTTGFCEIDAFCRRVIRQHWPHVPIYHDIRELRGNAVGPVDVVCGGFPCQDISLAGKGAGMAGQRSGLWSEYARIVGELRPRYVIVENVAALLHRGLDVVLGDLATLRFDAEWHCIPACAIGAPHVRDRVWIIAYADGEAEHAVPVDAEMAGLPPAVADTAGRGLAFRQRLLTRRQIADAAASSSGQWDDLPGMGRAVHGLPNRVDRIKALGNAVVPQIAELIGRAIMNEAR
jgi:DNA (cytosine-5)-methyltransferase 1